MDVICVMQSDLKVVSTEKVVLSSEKAALAVEVEELKRKLATIGEGAGQSSSSDEAMAWRQGKQQSRPSFV